jgi:tRNA-2-methylthio-N6-dimethylallyladenosine synthase
MNRPEPKNPPRTFHVKSFGCQMNVYDGERMAEMLGAQGMTAAEDGANADMVVLNTCHIREKAVDKVYSDIGRLKPRGRHPAYDRGGGLRRAGGGEEITPAPKMVDMVVGPQAYHRLPELVEKATRGEEALDTDMPAASKFGALPGRSRRPAPPPSSPCRKAATSSAPIASSPIRAAPRSAARGTRCSTRRRRWSMAARARSPLLGQNVNAWGDGERGLHDLSSRWTGSMAWRASATPPATPTT